MSRAEASYIKPVMRTRREEKDRERAVERGDSEELYQTSRLPLFTDPATGAFKSTANGTRRRGPR